VEVEEGVMRVLLVDDSPVDRKIAQLLLNSNSCAGSFHGQPSIQPSSCPPFSSASAVPLCSRICSVLLLSFYF
jgi:CheY-like chemotaxis protein